MKDIIMKTKTKLSNVCTVLALVVSLLLSPSIIAEPKVYAHSTSASYDKNDSRQNKKEQQRAARKDQRNQKKKEHSKAKSHKRVVVAPKHRKFRNIVVVRPHGHVYYGYGLHHSDHDAWTWLAFTAITLKILDNIDEEAQRAHEAAQVKATTSDINQVIAWETNDASGQVVSTRQGTNTQGKTCREFQQTISIGGDSEQAYGTACLQADGSWKMVTS
jgi:hypothetical protein